MKKFYDVHTHFFNLSHPNLSVFLTKEDMINSIIDSTLTFSTRMKLFASSFITKNYIKKQIHETLNSGIKERLNNTLGFFEIPMEYQFLVLEHFLKNDLSVNDKQIKLGEKIYDKIVLSPLIIDFGRKNIAKTSVYNLMPKTPTANQVGDLLYAIRTYYRFNVKQQGTNMSLSDEIENWENCKEDKLFEIYPFMGIDTENYGDKKDIEILLDKYFGDFKKEDTASVRRERLFQQMGKRDSNMYCKEKGYYYNLFAGIKLYPQLGFDPYPNEKEKLKKVRILYKYCEDRRIPITTHCSDGGYKTEDNDGLTDPTGKWAKVLEEYHDLTLNFAHFGSQKDKKDTKWRNAIIQLTTKYKNVYTDISCNDMSQEYYDQLEKDFKNNPLLNKKVLFGSDFSINMLVTKNNSYHQYLKSFANARLTCKTNLSEHNPEKFLFGGKL